MAFCPQCGSNVPDNAASCPQCGASLNAAQPQPQAANNQYQYQQQYQQPQYQQGYTPYPQYVPVDPKDHTSEFDAADISANKITAMAPYLLGVVGIIISLLAANDSKYAAFHARNALKLSICEILMVFCCIIPFLGWIACGIGEAMIVVINLICFVQVCKGKAKDAPIFGSLPFLK